MIRFILNEKEVATHLPPGMLLLDFIRYHQHLMGTRIGCREGDCGACTVLVGEIKNEKLVYQSMTCCLMPLGNAHGKHIVTIEGINFSEGLNPVQEFMAEEGATQCGFCTPGFVVSLAGFCLSEKASTTANAIAAVDGNICRCTGYKSIERAAAKLADLLKEKNGNPIQFATQQKILPKYFANIKLRLQTMENGALRTPDPIDIGSGLLTIVSGGTDLYVQRPEELNHANIHFVFNDPRLKGIRREGNKCIIRPSSTVSDLLDSPVIMDAFPNFPKYAKLISSTPIRNMATIAGNFVNASPIGDFTIFFLALDARIGLSLNPISEEGHSSEFHSNSLPGGNGLDGSSPNLSPGEVEVRTIPLRKFYKGYKELDKQANEMIENIWFELPAKNTFFNFEKVSKRTNLDIASVNSAICLKVNADTIEEAGLAAGGVGPVPLYLKKTSEFLKGKAITDELIEEAIMVMQTEISPITDARGSKEYKTLLLGQLIKAHFENLKMEWLEKI